jgi:Ca2+-binding EF-hand superfamily protein
MGCLKSKEKQEKLGQKYIFDYQEEINIEENQRYKEIDQLFYEYNKSNAGFLKANELTEAINDYLKRKNNDEVLKQKIESIISQLDVENLNKVTLEGFRILFSSIIYENIMLNELIHLFKTFDKKKDGKIDANEIKHIFKNLGLVIDDEVANQLVIEASLSKRNFIDFEEFIRAIIAK